MSNLLQKPGCDREALKQAVRIIFRDIRFDAGECIESRMLGPNGQGMSGWFDNLQSFVHGVAWCAEKGGQQYGKDFWGNLFWTVNPVSSDLLALQDKNVMAVSTSSTADADITRRMWLPIDCDPKRKSGISASKAEKVLGKAVANDVIIKLGEYGFSPEHIVVGTSGNGFHILVRVDLPNDLATTDLVKRFLKGVQALCGTDAVGIDQTVFNASRILRAYGTLAMKGVDTADRPHRMSKLLQVPDGNVPASVEMLERIAAFGGEKSAAKAGTKRKGPWTAELVQQYLADGTDWAGREKSDCDSRMLLKMVGDCPFDPNHKDAAVMLYDGGWPVFKCFHDSCSNKGWREFQGEWVEEHGAWHLPGATSPRLFAVEDVDAVTGESREGEIPLFNRTDMGVAERLGWRYSGTYRYCPQRTWFRYDGCRWTADEVGSVLLAAKNTVRAVPEEFSRWMATGDLEGHKDAEEFRKSLGKFAKSGEGRGRLESMVRLAQPLMPVDIGEFDRDIHVLNVQNGTVDLLTGVLRPHNASDLITQLAPIHYDPAALCPRWDRFVDEITVGDHELSGYLQRAIGHSLTGSTAEHAMWILYGSGGNGKSVFLETVGKLLGSYSQTAPMAVFMQSANDGIPNDLARMCGSRLVSAVEGEENKRLAESKIKAITGGDTVSARFLHKEFFEYRPTYKVWLATNEKPVIRGTDGIWGRLKLVPFTAKFSDGSKDVGLPGKLESELPGILNWALAGLRDFQKEGMREPTAIREATLEYGHQQDQVGRFLETEVEERSGESISALALYERFVEWLKQQGEFYKPANSKFTEAMRLKGFEPQTDAYPWTAKA